MSWPGKRAAGDGLRNAPGAQVIGRRRLRGQTGGWLLAAAVASLVAAGCATPQPTMTPPGAERTKVPQPIAKSVIVLHTNDNWGEVDPCG